MNIAQIVFWICVIGMIITWATRDHIKKELNKINSDQISSDMIASHVKSFPIALPNQKRESIKKESRSLG